MADGDLFEVLRINSLANLDTLACYIFWLPPCTPTSYNSYCCIYCGFDQLCCRKLNEQRNTNGQNFTATLKLVLSTGTHSTALHMCNTIHKVPQIIAMPAIQYISYSHENKGTIHDRNHSQSNKNNIGGLLRWRDAFVGSIRSQVGS